MKNILKLTGLILAIFLLIFIKSFSVQAVELNQDLKISIQCLQEQEQKNKYTKISYNQNISNSSVAPIAQSSYNHAVREAVVNHLDNLEEYVKYLSANGFNANVLMKKISTCLPKVSGINELKTAKVNNDEAKQASETNTVKKPQTSVVTTRGSGVNSNSAKQNNNMNAQSVVNIPQNNQVAQTAQNNQIVQNTQVNQATQTVQTTQPAVEVSKETKLNYNYRIVITDSMLDRSCYEQSGYLNSTNLCLWAGSSVTGDNKASYYCAHNYTKYGRLITALSVGSYVSINGRTYKIVNCTIINKYGDYGTYAKNCYYDCFRSNGDKAFFQTCSNDDETKMVIKEAILID